MNSVLNYIGQKNLNYLEQRDLDIIHNSQVYCEPFSGSFNLGIQLIDKGVIGVNTHRIVLNDLDKRVYNFWKELPINYEDVITKIDELSALDKEELSKFNHRNNIELAAIEFIYRQRQKRQEKEFDIDKCICEFYIQSEYMRNVEITNVDYKDVIERLDDNDTFFFIDPPYINVKSINSYYRCESNKFNHMELMSILKNTKSKFILTYNKDAIIHRYYREYNIRELSRSVYGVNYTELIISNF